MKRSSLSGWFLAKVLLLFFGFAAVVFTIVALRSGGLPSSLRQAFFIEKDSDRSKNQNAKGGPPGQNAAQLMWCSGRVTQVQSKVANLIESSNLRLEGWLNEYCSLEIESVDHFEVADQKISHSALEIKFSDGSRTVFHETNAGIFEWNGQYFTSAELKKAIESLKQLVDD